MASLESSKPVQFESHTAAAAAATASAPPADLDSEALPQSHSHAPFAQPFHGALLLSSPSWEVLSENTAGLCPFFCSSLTVSTSCMFNDLCCA